MGIPTDITHRIATLAEFHRLAGLPAPQHPLVSVIDYGQVNYRTDGARIGWVQDFYSIGLKRDIQGKFQYGQQQYDFDGGVMAFVSPGQVVSIALERPAAVRPSGWMLLVHPDFLWNTPLAGEIKQYEFFGYSINEALFLSQKEEDTLAGILRNIQREYRANIDAFTQQIIATQVTLLLNYCERFYQRQFITRKKSGHELLTRLETVLEACFNGDGPIDSGIPTAQYVAGELNISTNYLGSLLKALTGLTTQQHIHEKLIERAKEKLSTTHQSISEIAYGLGFEHPQSFSKLFKAKTDRSPIEFRRSFLPDR